MDAGAGEPEFQGRSMWWKTAAKRLEPWVPTSAEYRREQLRASAAAVTAAERPVAIAQEAQAGARDVVDAEIVDEQPQPGPAQRLEQPAQRRPRTQRQQAGPPPEDAPWPGDAAPAQAEAPDPRDDVRAWFDRAGIASHDSQMNYAGGLLDIAPPASLDSLARVQAVTLAGHLARCEGKAQLDAFLKDGTVPGSE
jgi:hypothetical protein